MSHINKTVIIFQVIFLIIPGPSPQFRLRDREGPQVGRTHEEPSHARVDKLQLDRRVSQRIMSTGKKPFEGQNILCLEAKYNSCFGLTRDLNDNSANCNFPAQSTVKKPL